MNAERTPSQRLSSQRTAKQSLKRIVKDLLGIERVGRRLNNQFERDNFVIHHLSKIPSGSLILDAGCGCQRYRESCAHLTYRAQDFGQFSTELKRMIGSDSAGEAGYEYGKLDYVGNIWKIEEQSNTFDAILCTEVLEHIPYPNETLREFSRLLKPHGKLILTAPSNCLRHMDPYYFYSGFSDRWFEKFLVDNNFEIEVIEVVGDYYSWLAVELARTAMSHSIFSKIMLGPAFLYYYNKKKTTLSSDTLCMGYQMVARKLK